jgi:hypothetical protein
MNYVYYALTISLFMGIAFMARKGRAQSNLVAIDRWFVGMDVTAHGQRYRGDRSTLLFTFYAEKTGMASVTTKRLYRTKSGRYFEMEITSEFSEVVHWKIDPVTAEDGDAFMEMVAEEESLQQPGEQAQRDPEADELPA